MEKGGDPHSQFWERKCDSPMGRPIKDDKHTTMNFPEKGKFIAYKK